MSSAILSLSPSERDLLRQIAQGDEQAFDRFYELYSEPVYHYALSLLRDRMAAEEILQEVFLAVWRGAHRFREEAQVKTWLLRIAHYQAVTWLRRNRSNTTLDEIEDVPANFVADELPDSIDIQRVQIALTRLTPKHRAVVELTFVYNLSYAEIAEVVNAPVGTVKSRMSYALRHLNQILASE